MEAALVLIRLVFLAVVVGTLGNRILRFLRRHSEPLKAGFRRARQRWRRWLLFAHLALVIVAACYLVVVAGNSIAFGYNFWTDPAPSSTADAVAETSIWILLLIAAYVGATTYAWICRTAGDNADGSLGQLRVALRSSSRHAALAVPAFAVTVAAIPFLIPAVFLVLIFGAAPLRYSRTPAVPMREYRRFLRQCFAPLSAIAIVVALLAIPVDAAVASGMYLTENHDGILEWTTWVFAWLSFALAVSVAGWAASAFSYVWERGMPAATSWPHR